MQRLESSVVGYRRRAFLMAAALLSPYAVLDVLNRSPSSAVARAVWVGLLVVAAVLQHEGRRRRADLLARLVGFTAGIAATLITASSGGSHSLNFGFLYAVPLCVLVLVPDLLSAAALAGVTATLGGCILLAHDHRTTGEVVQWIARSVSLGGVAAYGTVLYRKLIASELSANREGIEALTQLNRSEERFRAAFSSTSLGALIVSMDGTITVANPAARAMLGVDALEGRSYFDLLDPDDVPDARRVREIVLSGAAPPPVTRRFTRADGEQVLVSNHVGGLHGPAGGVESAIILMEDITERQQLREQVATSEALFRDLAERALVGIYVVQGRRFEYVNPRFAEIFGYERDEILGKLSTMDLTHPDDRARVMEAVRARIDGDAPRGLHYGFRALRKGGDPLDVEVYGTRTTYRSRPAIIGTLLDVSDRRRADEERIRIQKLESVGVLAGGIAHDFNNLLAVVMSNVSVAQEQAEPGTDLREVLDDAQAATLRARDLTKQLLTFARGGQPVRKRVELPEILRSSSSFAVRGSRCVCDCCVPDDLWAVHADEGQIAQVVQNLVLNAVQAMPGGGAIRVTADNVPAATGAGGDRRKPCVRVTVVDEGPGVPAGIADRIFDPYFTTKASGSGLGLASAHSIVTRHGGQIGVGAGASRGAAFWFTLPATDQPATARADRGAAQPRTGRVVVMDDDECVRKAALRVLRHLGYEVLAAGDGTEALAICAAARAQGRPVDVVLMDLTIPNGIGGAEAVRLLADREPGVKAIASSGYSSDPIMADHVKYGFSGVIAKPYRVEELRDLLAAVLGSRRAAA